MTAAPLAFRDAGPADSTSAVILIHGFPLNSGMWAPQLEVPPRGWRLLAPDLPGFGASPPGTAASMTMTDAADAVAELAAELGLQRVVLCGLSMGGYVTFALLRRHPALCRALVLCDTRAAADTEEVRRGRIQAAARVLRDGTADFVDGMLPKLLSPRTLDGRPDLAAAVRDQMAEAGPAAVAAALRGMAERTDATDLLRDITVPTLVLVGEDDAVTPVGEVTAMAGDIPGAQLDVISDAGHLPNLENPAAFNAALAAFLGSLA